MFKEYIGKWFRDDRYDTWYFFIELHKDKEKSNYQYQRNQIRFSGFTMRQHRRISYVKNAFHYNIENETKLKRLKKVFMDEEKDWLSRKAIRNIFYSD